MLRVVIILVALFTVVSCTTTTEEIEQTWDTGNPKKVLTYEGEGEDQIVVAQKEYHADGQLKIEGSFDDGKRNGVWKAYFEDGQVQSQYTYKAGMRDGKCIVYHPSGQVYFEGQWEKDQKVGVWTYFNEDGTISKPVNHSE